MKVSSPYPAEINAALKENMTSLEFALDGEHLPSLPLPIRIGEILDYIETNFLKTIHIGSFKLDTAKNIISQESKSLDLTEKDTAILKYLATTSEPATRDNMLKTIWGYSDTVDSKTVENHIYRLRQKIETAFVGEIIITENGVYRLID